MAEDKKIQIKLAATGGDQAAREVAKVEAAVEDLGKASEAAKGPDLSQMVPAWEQTTQAIDDATEATEAAAVSTVDLGKTVDAATDAMQGAGAASGGLGSRLIGLAGGPVGIVVAAVSAMAGWMASLKARIDAVNERQEGFARSARETSDRLAEIRTPADDAAEALARYQTAMEEIADGAEGAINQIDARTAATKRQRDAAASLRDAVLALAVAEGKISTEEAARQRGENTVSDLRAEAEAELAAAQAKNAEVEAAIQRSLREVTAAQEALRRARGDRGFLTTADQAAAANTAAARAQAEVGRINAEGPSLATAATRGGLTGLMGGAIDYGLQLRAQAEALEKAEAEQEALAAAAKGLTDLSEQEREAYEKRVADQEKTVAAAKRSLEQLRQQQAAAAAELVAADQNARLTERFGVPTAQTQTAAQLAGIRSQQAAEQERERERQAREAERQRAAQGDTEAVALAQNIRDRIAGAPNAGADAAGVLPLLAQIAQALSNGTNQTEIANIQAQLASAIDRLAADQTATRAVLEQVQSQLRNNPARG